MVQHQDENIFFDDHSKAASKLARELGEKPLIKHKQADEKHDKPLAKPKVLPKPVIMPPPPVLPQAKPEKVDHLRGIDVSLSDTICVQLSAKVCDAVEDVCSLLKQDSEAYSQQAAMCAAGREYCKKDTILQHFDLDAKICVNFSASEEACKLVQLACTGPEGEGPQRAMCQRAKNLCGL